MSIPVFESMQWLFISTHIMCFAYVNNKNQQINGICKNAFALNDRQKEYTFDLLKIENKNFNISSFFY